MDIIKRAGYKVSALDIERILLYILECYVNMRCLGCKYSKSLDSLIEELAKEIE
jgi:hypothetical protein